MNGTPPPLVSIIMPAYNYARFVEDAVKSAWAQTYPNLELIAVDDGSDDGTWERLTELAADSPLPMTVLQRGHEGVCAAMNAGLAVCKGDYVSVLHADDVYREDKVEKQMAAFVANPGAVLAHSEYQAIDEAGQHLEGLDSSLDAPPADGAALRGLLAIESDVRSMTMMYRTETMRLVGGYREHLPSEDWQSILLLAAAGEVVHVAQPLVYRRVHKRSFSVHLYRRSPFSIHEIAPDVLEDVAPADLNLEGLKAYHVATVIRNSLAEGNTQKAREAFTFAARSYPRSRGSLRKAYAMGTMWRIWIRHVRPRLPDAAIGRLRNLKRSFRRHGRL